MLPLWGRGGGWMVRLCRPTRPTPKRRQAAALQKLLWGALFVSLLVPACGRKTAVRPPELAAPEAIDSLSASNAADGVRLTWRRPTKYADGQRMTDLGAFRVERSTAAQPFTPIATLALSDQDRFQQERRFRTTDPDTAVGEIYQYRIISLTTDGYVSEPSNIVSIERVIPTPAPTAAATPTP